MAAISGDQLRGHLEGLILPRSTGCGTRLGHLARLEAASGGALAIKEGSLYPALYRLERQGLVVARWDVATADRPGPRRRVYRLTAKGRCRLKAAARRSGGSLSPYWAACWEHRHESLENSRSNASCGRFGPATGGKIACAKNCLAHLTRLFEEELTRKRRCRLSRGRSDRPLWRRAGAVARIAREHPLARTLGLD